MNNYNYYTSMSHFPVSLTAMFPSSFVPPSHTHDHTCPNHSNLLFTHSSQNPYLKLSTSCLVITNSATFRPSSCLSESAPFFKMLVMTCFSAVFDTLKTTSFLAVFNQLIHLKNLTALRQEVNNKNSSLHNLLFKGNFDVQNSSCGNSQ